MRRDASLDASGGIDSGLYTGNVELDLQSSKGEIYENISEDILPISYFDSWVKISEASDPKQIFVHPSYSVFDADIQKIRSKTLESKWNSKNPGHSTVVESATSSPHYQARRTSMG